MSVARAGEAGKGFAVVASEVKHLANQTGKATEEIGNKITAVQEQTRLSVEAIESIGVVIGKVKTISTTIAAAVEEQGAATREISQNAQRAANGTQDVSANVGGVSKAVAENGETEKLMVEAARKMGADSDLLRQKVLAFLNHIRQQK